MKVYLAGKISKGDWRQGVVSGLDGYGDQASGDSPWPVLKSAICGEHDYTGPYFIGCDHGCFHGADTHGVGAYGGLLEATGVDQAPGAHCSGIPSQRKDVRANCMKAIAESDVVFAWLDSLDAFGTLVEIGAAHALNKTIIIAGPAVYHDLWFAYECADSFRITEHPKWAIEYYFARQAVALDQPTTLKAIETQWNGFRFRSRLEARWAIFFDTLGIRFEYEPEGFELDNVGRYLPDFWLPDLNVWVEIKREGGQDEGWEKCWELAKQSGKNVLFVLGNPWPNEYKIIDFKPSMIVEQAHDQIIEGEWAECRRCDGFWVTQHGESAYSLLCTCAPDLWKEPLYGEDAPRLMKAYKTARSARFEHGEKG